MAISLLCAKTVLSLLVCFEHADSELDPWSGQTFTSSLSHEEILSCCNGGEVTRDDPAADASDNEVTRE